MNNLTSKKRRMQYILRSIAKPPLDYGSITTNIFTKKNPKPSYVMSGKQHNTVLENKVKNLIDLLQPKEKLKTLEKHWKKTEEISRSTYTEPRWAGKSPFKAAFAVFIQ